ncbi:MAG: hypothetical protein J0H01_08455 [Rhizobiales bacterium]|nr:hypothetical protein [Hyphomicrobiales bacterium]
MATEVAFVNPATGQLRNVKIGWSWTLFLFSTLFGIPLFMRGLNGLATAFLIYAGAFMLVSVLGDDHEPWRAIGFIMALFNLMISIYLGLSGNEMTARHYIKNGWQIAFPDTPAAAKAREEWALSPN